MLVTNNIISTVIIPANFNDYSYEFAVFSNTCLSPAVGEILSSGNFSISGTVIVSADITYDNACDITVSLNLLYNESICETMFVSINSSATGNYIHYECIENICQPVLTEYDSNDPTHYPSPDCDGECISYPPETYSCDNNCYEPILGGLYQTQEQCVNNCDFPETGYTCYNNCMSPVTGGQYTTSGECLEICPTSCQTYLGWGNYICNTNTVEYEIENLNGEYSVDLGICYGYTEGMTYPTGSFVCNEDISTQQSVTINITDSLGCTAQIIVPIICDNNPCESTIAGTFVSGQSSTTTNDCGRVVPPITNNWHCQGEDCTYENIYTSPSGLSGFYEYKYRKIVQGINSCPNSIVAYYAFVPANNKYLAYPTQSKIVVNSNTYYNGSYNVLTSNITPYLSVLSSNNGTINMTVVDDWSIDNVGNDLQVRNYIRDAFDLWGELISYAFGINFSFDMCLWNEPESNTTTSEYKADFYVSMIQPNPIDNLNIFYTGFTANGMPITYDGFGTPLNYTDIALAKGGVIVINSESNANWVSGTPISVSGEVNFKAQIFNFIGHSLGLRSPYYEAAVSSTANTCAPDGCISDCEANSLFSIYNPTTFNTFMAMVLQGADIDSYIVDGLLNDAICVECLQKRYLTV